MFCASDRKGGDAHEGDAKCVTCSEAEAGGSITVGEALSHSGGQSGCLFCCVQGEMYECAFVVFTAQARGIYFGFWVAGGFTMDLF